MCAFIRYSELVKHSVVNGLSKYVNVDVHVQRMLDRWYPCLAEMLALITLNTHHCKLNDTGSIGSIPLWQAMHECTFT